MTTARDLIRALKSRSTQALTRLILGRHPNNSICSFNFHNVRHIIKFISDVQNQIDSNMCLVDIGAGASPYYYLFFRKVAEYIAVDLEGGLPLCESRDIRQVVGSAERIPLGDSIAHVVLSNQVLEHVDDPDKAVREAYRLLKPCGKFIGSVPHVSPVHLEPCDYRRYTDYGIEQLLKSNGFSNIKISLSGGVYSASALMIAMDWMLTSRDDSKPQGFSLYRALLFAPIVGIMNLFGLVMDKLFASKKSRSFANLCWIAEKPLVAL
jgi:SAM-dependent methyltransferase